MVRSCKKDRRDASCVEIQLQATIALGAIGAAAALLLAVLVFAIPRMAGEGEHSATSSNEPTVEEEDPFTIELLADGRGILLAGRLSHGMTEQLESLLGGGAPIIHIELNSPGGLVAEAPRPGQAHRCL